MHPWETKGTAEGIHVDESCEPNRVSTLNYCRKMYRIIKLKSCRRSGNFTVRKCSIINANFGLIIEHLRTVHHAYHYIELKLSQCNHIVDSRGNIITLQIITERCGDRHGGRVRVTYGNRLLTYIVTRKTQ